MKQKLFDDFEKVSAKAWKQKIQYELKGADYNQNLVWESPEGIKVKPFYHADDLQNPIAHTIEKQTPWKITQSIPVNDSSVANKNALNALKGGAESILFTLPSPAIDYKTLLAEIATNQKVSIYCEFKNVSTADSIKLTETQPAEAAAVSFQIDPIGQLARTGNWFTNMAEDLQLTHKLLQASTSKEHKNSISIDAALYQNAGGNRVQQLAYALAHANEYLNWYGSTMETITFKVAVGSNYFFEIAKIRALRRLWKLLATEYGITANCQIEAVPSKRNKTLYDYNMNMIRTTTECMAAILGGADCVCNLNYDFIYHKNNAFAERIARNQLLLLKEESYFNTLQNPAEGAYYIESITDQLAEKALLLFKDIEANGGFLKQLKYHTVHKKLKESAQKEQERFNTSQEILVGSNAYVNGSERMKDQLEVHPFGKQRPVKTLIEPILEKRLSEGLEKERLQTEGWQAR